MQKGKSERLGTVVQPTPLSSWRLGDLSFVALTSNRVLLQCVDRDVTLVA